MIGLVTQEAMDRQNAATAAKAATMAGGEIARGHHVSTDQLGHLGLDCQPPRVSPPWQAGVDGDGPMADGVREHRPHVTVLHQAGASSALGSSLQSSGTGQAVVEHMDAAGAASPGLPARLGERAPSGIPGQPPDHVAPTGVGARFRENAPQAHAANLYLPGPKAGAR
jgi:hypothetical protein